MNVRTRFIVASVILTLIVGILLLPSWHLSILTTSYGDYNLRVLIVESDSTLHSHLMQTLVYNVTVDTWPVSRLDGYDVVFLYNHQPIPGLEKYVQQGGHLCIIGGNDTDAHVHMLPEPITPKPTFPQTPRELHALQKVLQDWLALYPTNYTLFQPQDIPNTPLLTAGEYTLASSRAVGLGTITWFSDLFLATQYSIDLTFADPKPFHPGLAAMTGFLVDELLHYVSIEKYGFSLARPLGAYGTPLLAWQNHYEASHALARRDYAEWYTWLKEFGQVPSFYLVQQSFDWGAWQAGLVEVPLQNTKNVSVENTSIYSTGVVLRDIQGYMQFGKYPGYKTLFSHLENAFRTVPQKVGDYLLVGAPNGKVYITKQTESKRYNMPQPLARVATSANAAPFYSTGSLLLGGADGSIKVYKETGQFEFVEQGVVKLCDQPLVLPGSTVPVLTGEQLYVGDELGQVYLLSDPKQGFNYTKMTLLLSTGERAAAPYPYDWNNDGQLDLLVGGETGHVRIYLNIDGSYKYAGHVESPLPNILGNRTVFIGRYSVPRVTNQGNLLLGGAMYGIPYSIDDPDFPYFNEAKSFAAWVQQKHLKMGAHLTIQPGMKPEEEQLAYEKHRLAFTALNLPWQHVGTNHHSWYITRPEQSFSLQANSGIAYNFGFRPNGIPGAPKDGQAFAVIRPFVYITAGSKPILLYQPAPDPFNLPAAWAIMARRLMPITCFQHIEYMRNQQDDLLKRIKALQAVREKHGYAFATEDQLAMAMAAVLTAQLHVKIAEDHIIINPITSKIPSWVDHYCNAIGVTVRTKDDVKAYSDSLVQHYTDGVLTFGLPSGQQVVHFNKDIRPPWWVEKTNSPLHFELGSSGTKITLLATGFQELHVAGSLGKLQCIEATQGESCVIANTRLFHYGTPITVEVAVY